MRLTIELSLQHQLNDFRIILRTNRENRVCEWSRQRRTMSDNTALAVAITTLSNMITTLRPTPPAAAVSYPFARVNPLIFLRE